MTFAKTIVAVVLLALWAPLSVHCTLEAVSGLELIGCCFAGESEPHQDNDCSDDGCDVVESGQYITSQREVEVTAPMLLLTFDVSSFLDADPVSPDAAMIASTMVPGELASSWQFLLRSAPSPRAPSFLS